MSLMIIDHYSFFFNVENAAMLLAVPIRKLKTIYVPTLTTTYFYFCRALYNDQRDSKTSIITKKSPHADLVQHYTWYGHCQFAL